MKKDYLLYLKKALSIGCMVTSLGLLTACDADDVTDNDKIIVEEVDEEDKKADDVKLHDHLMVDIGGITYIFRECDETIGEIKIATSSGSFKFYIYDKNDELILIHDTYADSNITNVYSEKQEMAIQALEETAIEKGAVVYKISPK